MRIPSPLLLVLLALGGAGPLGARVDLLLVPPPEHEPPSARPVLILYLNNPTEFDSTFRFDGPIMAEYAAAEGHVHLELKLVNPQQSKVAVPSMSRCAVKLEPVREITGRGRFVSLRLRSPATNAIMLPLPPVAPPADDGAAGPGAGPVGPAPVVRRPGLGRRHIDLTSDIESMRRHISGYDPIYFALGWRERFNARFQFSFKYRLADPGPGEPDAGLWGTLAGMTYLAYTQTSIWDLESFSKPFYDSSYKPTLFLVLPVRRTPWPNWSFSLQAGAQHESNGKGGGSAPVPSRPGLIASGPNLRHSSDTRSLNTLYLLPRARWENAGHHFFEAGLRANAYFQADENPDIAQYRGYAELTLRGGYVRGLQLSAHVRGRASGHGSVELNLTWPTSETPMLQAFPLITTLGGYAQIQYFNGYGESLLDYDVRRKDQLRFGMMIVR
jgi:outer membrane phospholipase A